MFALRDVIFRLQCGLLFLMIKTSHGRPTLTSPVTATSAVLTTIPVHEIEPLEIDDGQSTEDKLKVIELLSTLEEKVAAKFNISEKNISNEMPYLFEEDIILQPSQVQEILESGNKRQRRKLHADPNVLWKLPIWYTYHPDVYNSEEAEGIHRTLDNWESVTCITFKKIDYNYLSNETFQEDNENQVTLNFTKSKECWSFVGKRNFPDKVQKISAGGTCVNHGSLMHEIGHVIGFWHEHARPDRDDYIEINHKNIADGKDFNFIKMTWKDIDDKNISYDVGSVMHYSSMAFAAKKKGFYVGPTLITRDKLLQRAIGQRDGLSFYDVKLANVAYCEDVCAGINLSHPCQHDGYQDPKNCSRCRCPDGLSGDFCEIAQDHDGDNCGGNIIVSETKQTIEFIGKYKKGQKCSWHLKAPRDNMNIVLNFEQDFMMYYGCTNNPDIRCRDYVEVRYFHNLAATGARFCCFNDPPAPEIRSHGNEMLILMRAHGDGEQGFKATVVAESCGGCKSSSKPCSRSVPYTCEREFQNTNSSIKPPCSVWFGLTSDKCFTPVTVIRYSKCYRTEHFCCDGYELRQNTCIVSSTNTSGYIATSTNGTVITYAAYSNTSHSIQNDAGTGWSAWSNWSNCSARCGGCGVKTRNRTCDDVQTCGNETVKEETIPCNDHLCDKSIVQTCVRKKKKTVQCFNMFTLTTCTIYETELYPCFIPCCNGYMQQGNKCVVATV